jgi:hypothetical protein
MAPESLRNSGCFPTNASLLCPPASLCPPRGPCPYIGRRSRPSLDIVPARQVATFHTFNSCQVITASVSTSARMCEPSTYTRSNNAVAKGCRGGGGAGRSCGGTGGPAGAGAAEEAPALPSVAVASVTVAALEGASTVTAGSEAGAQAASHAATIKRGMASRLSMCMCVMRPSPAARTFASNTCGARGQRVPAATPQLSHTSERGACLVPRRTWERYRTYVYMQTWWPCKHGGTR